MLCYIERLDLQYITFIWIFFCLALGRLKALRSKLHLLLMLSIGILSDLTVLAAGRRYKPPSNCSSAGHPDRRNVQQKVRDSQPGTEEQKDVTKTAAGSDERGEHSANCVRESASTTS